MLKKGGGAIVSGAQLFWQTQAADSVAPGLPYGRLMEELVPFMDAGIHDMGVAQLSTGHLKRKQAAPQPESKVCHPCDRRRLF